MSIWRSGLWKFMPYVLIYMIGMWLGACMAGSSARATLVEGEVSLGWSHACEWKLTRTLRSFNSATAIWISYVSTRHTLTTCIKRSWSKLLFALRSGIPDQAPTLQPCPEPPAETSGRTPGSPASRLLSPLASTLTPFSVAWYLQAWACCFPSSPPSSQMALHRKLWGTQCSARCAVTQQRWKPAVSAWVISIDVAVVRVGLRFGVGEGRAGY